jgi:hypothetical protein
MGGVVERQLGGAELAGRGIVEQLADAVLRSLDEGML